MPPWPVPLKAVRCESVSFCGMSWPAHFCARDGRPRSFAVGIPAHHVQSARPGRVTFIGHAVKMVFGPYSVPVAARSCGNDYRASSAQLWRATCVSAGGVKPNPTMGRRTSSAEGLPPISRARVKSRTGSTKSAVIIPTEYNAQLVPGNPNKFFSARVGKNLRQVPLKPTGKTINADNRNRNRTDRAPSLALGLPLGLLAPAFDDARIRPFVSFSTWPSMNAENVFPHFPVRIPRGASNPRNPRGFLSGPNALPQFPMIEARAHPALFPAQAKGPWNPSNAGSAVVIAARAPLTSGGRSPEFSEKTRHVPPSWSNCRKPTEHYPAVSAGEIDAKDQPDNGRRERFEAYVNSRLFPFVKPAFFESFFGCFFVRVV